MDKFKELTTGAKLVLGAAVLLFIFSWFTWFDIEGDVTGVANVNMWNGIGVLAGLLLIALIVWQGLRLANINLEIGVTPAMITAALAVLTLIFVFIRWIDKPGGGIVAEAYSRTIWSWIGLALAIILVVGAFLNMQAAGEGIAEIRAAAAGAASAARGAADRGDAPAAAAPPPASSAPEPPAAAEPPPPPPPPPAADAPESTEPDDTPRAS